MELVDDRRSRAHDKSPRGGIPVPLEGRWRSSAWSTGASRRRMVAGSTFAKSRHFQAIYYFVTLARSGKREDTVRTRDVKKILRTSTSRRCFRASPSTPKGSPSYHSRSTKPEKFFAAHQLRISDGQRMSTGGQSASVQLSPAQKVLEEMSDRTFPSPEKSVLEDGRGKLLEFDADSLLRMVDNLEYNMKQSQVETFKGRSYESYMAKRDAKLREQRRSKKAHKRLEFEKMEKSFALTWAQMKAQFRWSHGTQNSSLQDRQDKQIQRNSQDRMKSFQSDKPLDEQVQHGQEKYFDDALIGLGSSKSTNSTRLLYSRSASSTPLHPSVTSIPKSLTKAANSTQTKQKIQSQNHLAQTLPNVNFRKEYVNPTTVISKVNNYSESTSFTRSKSAAEGIKDFEEEKLSRFQHIRCRSVSFGELKGMPKRFHKEQSVNIMPNKTQKQAESKPFLRRGSGIGPGAGASVVKMRVSKITNIPIKEDEPEDFENFSENSPNLHKKIGEELKIRSVKTRSSAFHSESDSQESRLSQESVGDGEDESESNDVRPFAHVDNTSASSASESEVFIANVVVPPKESGESRNLSLLHLHFLRPEHVAESIDNSVNEGSPASCNSHSLKKMHDAYAEKQILATNASDQSLKNVMKGFKRLLKFGRKSKRADGMVNDLISSTASKGY